MINISNMLVLDKYIKKSLNERLERLEVHLSSDIVALFGPIWPPMETYFRDFIEKLGSEFADKQQITIFITCPGGLAETVEKLVDIIRFHYRRFHYREVCFIVPDYAMSAGTIFCMSGDKIYMDYSSSLGPIDPQVYTGRDYVSALGYLDQVDTMVEKSRQGTLSDAELVMLQQLDLAMLSSYEQAKNLTITLLKKWLVQYKFANWDTHRTDTTKLGTIVTQQEKEQRAEEIANMLANNKLWHSHGRKIGLDALTGPIRLEIDDYSQDVPFRAIIRDYHDFMLEYIQEKQYKSFLHSKNYF